ncbi:MAG: adenylate/guanylate cyclase domain-containing protein [Zetaproteobacteria bacterium]|nr:MAG: adenylate/guanylate cyclase domain-containing protein [Zetaproteobacteria bacterium]
MPATGNKPPIQMFLPPETLAMLASFQGELPDRLVLKQDMLVLFSDMRGFTELSERMPAEEVYRLLHASMELQARFVHRYGGSINKFLGDGLLACFSGEDKALRAVRCVRALLRALTPRAGRDAACRVGFGMHSGQVLFGIIGDDARREFALIGDVVNTAARLCGLARPFQALTTAAVFQALPEDVRCAYLRPQGKTAFRGKKERMDVYSLVP